MIDILESFFTVVLPLLVLMAGLLYGFVWSLGPNYFREKVIGFAMYFGIGLVAAFVLRWLALWVCQP